MKKVGFLLIVGLLAMLSVIAAISYSSAVVESTAQIKIVSTDEALLALKPGTDDAVEALCSIDEDGSLFLSFSISPNTVIALEKLFWVKNNSADKIAFTIENVSEDIKYLYVKPDWPIGSLPPAVGSLMINNGANTYEYFTLDSGSEVPIGVAFDVPGNAEKTSYNGSLLVKAEAIQ